MKRLLDTLRAIAGSVILLIIVLIISALLDSVFIAYLGIAFFFITNLLIILSPLIPHKRN
ncbi:hypothetical protein [Thermodesulfovibrio yellowstonii]|uniref:hypothetical protein n=1 Tax=Thermodesulfovibrio yellowstonii TaxID=28262 RepID=UPI0024B39838|nr:hypothetical protein [Thermodesulfovibrio yellowstonii]MDI6865809.1 hypothetical protein [Thermodesulfovibrio yellowstonii]